MPIPVNLSNKLAFRLTKNGNTFAADCTKTEDITGSVVNQMQIVGLSAELVDFGDLVGVPRVVVVKNNDVSNYVELALDSGMTNKFAKILPGRFASFVPYQDAIYVKANSAPCNILTFAVGA